MWALKRVWINFTRIAKLTASTLLDWVVVV